MANSDLTRVKHAVCSILGKVGQPQNFKGSGFHYGNGWIMTVAHNFQDDEIDGKKSEHSVLSSGQFRVQFDIEGTRCEFKEHRRMAFVHHLEPGEYTDFKNKDIAMVKLGIQYEYGRQKSDYSAWENEEKDILEKMKSHFCALAQTVAPEPKVDDDVDAVHYGGNDNKKKHDQQVKIKRITAGQCAVPMLHLEKKAGVLAEGASGCPVMLKKEGKYHLVGLHFSGDDDEEDGEAEALSWNKGIRDYIQKGVEIIADIGSYMAYTAIGSKLSGEMQESANDRAKESETRLKTAARDAHLTIYLSNGKVVDGHWYVA